MLRSLLRVFMKYGCYVWLLVMVGIVNAEDTYPNSLTDQTSWNKHCYAGLSYQYYYARPAADFTDIFHTHYHGFNFYLGVAPLRFLAFEFGNSFNIVRRTQNEYPAGSMPFGSRVREKYIMNAKIRYKSFNFDARALLVENYRGFPLYGTLGLAVMHPTVRFIVTPDTADVAPINSANLGTLNRASGNTRLVPRIGLGSQCMVTENFGWRLDGLFMQTSRIQLKGADALNTRRIVQNSFVMQAGAFFNLDW